MHFDFNNWQSLIQGAVVYGALSYAARTIPPVENQWGRWLIGILQYVVANPEHARKALLEPRVAAAQDACAAACEAKSNV